MVDATGPKQELAGSQRKIKQETKIKTPVPQYGVYEYAKKLENASYKENQPEDNARASILLMTINEANKRGNWKEDKMTVERVIGMVKERFTHIIEKKKTLKDDCAVEYFQERLQALLNDPE